MLIHTRAGETLPGFLRPRRVWKISVKPFGALLASAIRFDAVGFAALGARLRHAALEHNPRARLRWGRAVHDLRARNFGAAGVEQVTHSISFNTYQLS